MSSNSMNIQSPQADEAVDKTLRPKFFNEYVGQDKAKAHLEIILAAAMQRQDIPDHILLYGPPGLGKTTLAHIIANRLQVKIFITSGNAIERTGDIAAILTNLEPNSILFIDEIHRLPQAVEELLYPAMEDQVIDLTIGKGPSAKTLRIDLPRFLLIGATTRIGSLSNPFRDRFGSILKLEFYSQEEIFQILKRSARILKIIVNDDSLFHLAARSRMTPRIANRLLKRVRDLATVRQVKNIQLATVNETFGILEIDEFGLDATDRKLLDTIISKYQGGPVGLKNIAASLAEDPLNIEMVIEPYLLQIGLVKRTAQGRVATQRAYEILGQKQYLQNKIL